MICSNEIYILGEPEFRVSLVQKSFWVTYHKVGETPQFFWNQNQSNIGQFILHNLKNCKYLICANLHKCIFRGGSLLSI